MSRRSNIVTAVAIVVALLGGVWGVATFWRSRPVRRATVQPTEATAQPRLIVRYRVGTAAPARLRVGALGLTRRSVNTRTDIVRLAKGADPKTTLARAQADPSVAWASLSRIYEPVGVGAAAVPPDDPRYASGEQWWLSSVAAPTAWLDGFDRGTRRLRSAGAAVPVAVLDTGFDLDHPDLAGRIRAGWDAGDRDGDVSADDPTRCPYDGYAYYHGTAVAGVLASISDNGLGTASVGYDGTAVGYKVAGHEDPADPASGIFIRSEYVHDAIVRAADDGRRIISMSLGAQTGGVPDPYIQEAVDYARSKGAIVIAAAGNDGGAVMSPACGPGVIAVGATGPDGRLTTWSSRGKALDITAPGAGVWTTTIDWGAAGHTPSYLSASGTSLSTPIVAGAAAYLWRLAPGATTAEIEAALAGAGTLGEDSGVRALDVAASADALREAMGPALAKPDLRSAARFSKRSGTIRWPAVATRGVRYLVSVDGGPAVSTPSPHWHAVGLRAGRHTLAVGVDSDRAWAPTGPPARVTFMVR
jgi:subtilisin family serine protease